MFLFCTSASFAEVQLFNSLMPQKTKIAIVCDFPAWIANSELPQAKGHYAIWLTTLYNSFERISNYEIHWITLQKGITSTSRFKSKNQYFHIIPAVRKTIGLYTMYLSDRRKVKNEIKQIHPQLIHTWGTEYCYGLCGKDSNHKYWLHSVQGLLKAYMQRCRLSRFQRHHSFYEPRVLQRAPFLTTESPWAAERVKEISPRANPVLWEYAVEDIFFSMERHLSDEPSCLYCGSNSAIKNIDTLITAFSSSKLSHIKLYLAGPHPDSFKNLPPNIIPLGRQSRDSIANLMSQSWCLVHLSFADTGPTAVKEARVMRLPVIISDECGSQQHIIQGKSGFVIKPTDVNSLINHVLYITQSKEKALEMGCFDAEQIRQKLSPHTMVTQLINIYTSILKSDSNE